ncbi:MAG: DNA polymerase III subunit alpha, partial [Defluviitaleaceae bacterium]|nr:DNA polymerase III subunit alpha [Defluviitaleaceae bacterium]
GLPRHASTHAAGVVISDAPLTEYVPLNTNDGAVTTQFSMGILEELGLLKMDFLGLRTLTVIKHTVNEIKRRHGVEIDLATMDMQVPKVFETIASGKTEGMFQLESRGMTSFMKELKPTSIKDLTAGISLFRPGPMDFIPKYIKAKNGGAVTYTHPSLEHILEETYGCIVYQEQVMQIVRELAGYSLGRADLIRRAMSKKTESVMKQEKEYFIHGIKGEVAGCVANGIPQNIAEQIWEEMADFAKYAFNKAHAAAYATIGYQTAWLKMYYPAEFMAALLTSVMDSLSKITEYIAECKRMGLDVLPPDINQSFGHFTVNDNGNITFGMNAIKNLGRPTVAALTRERAKGGIFKSLTDFVSRLDEGEINKRSLESLIKAGALTSLGGKRSQYMHIFEGVLQSTSASRKTSMKGQISLLDMAFEDAKSEEILTDALPNIPEFPLERALHDEKEVLGIYVSGHPINAFDCQMKPFVDTYSRDLAQGDEGEILGNLTDGQKITIGGIITKKNITYTRKTAAAMCFMTIEDIYGYMESVIFPELFNAHSGQLTEGEAVIIEGKASLREDQAGVVIAEKIRFLQKEKPATLWLKVPEIAVVQPVLDILSAYGGTTPVVIYVEATKERLNVNKTHWVNSDAGELLDRLKELLGDGAIVLK